MSTIPANDILSLATDLASNVGSATPGAPVSAPATLQATPTQPPPAEICGFVRGDEVELAEHVLCALGTTDLVWDEGELHIYSPGEGIYRPIPHEMLTDMLSRYSGWPVVAGNRTKPLRLSEKAIAGAIKLVRARTITAQAGKTFAMATPGLAFTNGFLTIQAGQLLLWPHSPSHLARYSYPWQFDPNTTAPKLDQLMNELFSDTNPMQCQAQKLLLQQYTGVSLFGLAARYQRALVLHGPGANGKSTAMTAIKAIFPPGAVASLPPQVWGKQFQIAQLCGKLINVVHEIPESEIVAGALFKSVISGEPVFAEKKFKDPFHYSPIAGHIFAANSLPATVDYSHGFWRRLLVVPFTRDMEQTPQHRPDAAADVITAELPGMVNWAVWGAVSVFGMGGYAEPESSRQMKEQWQQQVDPVRLFAATECAADPNTRTPARGLYEAFRRFVDENGFRDLKSTTFYQRFNQLGFKSKHGKDGNFYNLLLVRNNAAPIVYPNPHLPSTR